MTYNRLNCREPGVRETGSAKNGVRFEWHLLKLFWMAIQSDSFAEYGARLGHQGEGLGSSLDDSWLNAPGSVGDTMLTDKRKQNLVRVVRGVIEPMVLPSVVKLQHVLEAELSRQAAHRQGRLRRSEKGSGSLTTV